MGPAGCPGGNIFIHLEKEKGGLTSPRAFNVCRSGLNERDGR